MKNDNHIPQEFDRGRRAFTINGSSPLGGSASDLANVQLLRAHALAAFAQQAFLDADIADGTPTGSNLQTFNCEPVALVMDTIAHLIAESEFYRDQAALEQRAAALREVA
jgi:hypothetical protein